MNEAIEYLLDTDMCIYLLNGDALTNNTEHFERIAGISVENWL